MKTHKSKRQGLGLEFETFKGKGKEGKRYLVFRSRKRGGYHVFVETEAKESGAGPAGSSAPGRRINCGILFGTPSDR